jgi:hypothetical protein
LDETLEKARLENTNTNYHEGRKEGRKKGRKDGWMDVLIDGWTELTQYKAKL